jgi:hypothetical protein
MDLYQQSLMAEYHARERQAAVAAAAERRGRLGELPQGAPLREGFAKLLVSLALRLAPDRTLPEAQHAAVRHLA